MTDSGVEPRGYTPDQTARIPSVGLEAQTWPSDAAPPRLPPADQATVDALQPGTALLIVLRGPNTGARFLLDTEEVTVGRHPSSEIFLDDVTVSRRHALFVRSPEGYAVRDIGSLNGTYVNRNLIEEIGLDTGDEVQIGKFRLVYYASPRTAQ